MKPCREVEPLLLDRAAGALAPEQDARLAAHLQTCFACRSESRALAEALSLAALPPEAPMPEAERRAEAAAALEAWRKRRATRRLGLGFAAGLAAVAASAAVVAIAPALRHGPLPGTGGAPAAAAARWEEPDLDAVWEASEAALANSMADDESASAEGAIFAEFDDSTEEEGP